MVIQCGLRNPSTKVRNSLLKGKEFYVEYYEPLVKGKQSCVKGVESFVKVKDLFC